MTDSTKKFVAVSGIRGKVVILKNGSFRSIMMVGGINFDLYSEQERKIIIGGWQQFLNGLDFSVQIILHSRNFNVDGYLANLEPNIAKEQNGLLKLQGREYVEFIKSFTELANVMSKTFYIIIPYDPIKIKSKRFFSGLLGSKKPGFTIEDLSEEEFKEASKQLELRVESITNSLTTIGIRAVTLDEQELFELFYNYYNPTFVEHSKPAPDISA